jgi:hypothetical protein
MQYAVTLINSDPDASDNQSLLECYSRSPLTRISASIIRGSKLAENITWTEEEMNNLIASIKKTSKIVPNLSIDPISSSTASDIWEKVKHTIGSDPATVILHLALPVREKEEPYEYTPLYDVRQEEGISRKWKIYISDPKPAILGNANSSVRPNSPLKLEGP